MRILFGLLILSLATVLLALGAMWWRVRRHMRHPHLAHGTVRPESHHDPVPPEREPVD